MSLPMDSSTGAVSFGKEFFDDLCGLAAANPRRRAHHNIHEGYDDPCQRLLVGIQTDSYIRPHRHQLTPKPETLFCLRGSIGVLIFDDSGCPSTAIRLAACTETAGCEIQTGSWHSLVCLQPDSVFLEVKPGPYTPFQPEDFAPWSPEVAHSTYLAELRSQFA